MDCINCDKNAPYNQGYTPNDLGLCDTCFLSYEIEDECKCSVEIEYNYKIVRIIGETEDQITAALNSLIKYNVSVEYIISGVYIDE